jgi:hypothetical protein
LRAERKAAKISSLEERKQTTHGQHSSSLRISIDIQQNADPSQDSFLDRSQIKAMQISMEK